MAIPLTINGATFEYPVNFDENWGIEATGWAQAVTNGMLQRAGGNFPLLADVNFGPNFGLLSAYFETRITNPASSGLVRLSKTDVIDWRNNANSADNILAVNSSDQLTYNGTIIGVATGVTSITGTVNEVIASASTGNITLSLPQPIATGSTPVFLGLTLTGPTASRALTLNGANVVATSTTTTTELGFVSGVTSSIQPQINALSSEIAALSPFAIPSGAMLDFAGTSAPSGWLLCDGSSYAASSFPTLFSAIGYTWGGTSTTPIARVQATIQNTTAANPNVISFGSSVTVGSLIVVMIQAALGTAGDIHVVSITDDVGNTYQAAPGAFNPDMSLGISTDIWYAKNSIASATTVTINYNATPIISAQTAAIEYSGADINNPVVSASTLQMTGSSAIGPILTTNDPHGLLITGLFKVSTNPTGVNSPWAVVPGDIAATFVDVVAPGSTGMFQAVFTPSSTDLYLSSGVSFRSNPTGSNFSVPDMRRRVGVGSGGSGTATIGNGVGATGGEETHTLTQTELSIALGTASSTVTDPGHPHNLSHTYANLVGGSASGGDDSPAAVGGTAITASSNTTGITVDTTITNSSGGNPHNVIQPSAIVLKIIKT